jgi:DNA-binding transcriptional ArsR family regulator
VPVAFHWPGLSGLLDDRWQQPALIYRPRGLATLGRRDPPAVPGGLAKMLGRRRVEILGAMDEPITTSQLAAALGTAVSNVSEHLAVLRRGGLVTGERDGIRVLYRRTETGDRLLDAVG